MADNQSRPQLITIILTIILCINVIVMIVGFVMLFFSHDSYGVNAASISSASALFNCVGVTLLMRWHKTGIFFSVLASLLSSITLSITCAGWLNYSFGELGFFIPYIVFVIYMVILFVLLFVKIRGESLWQQMMSALLPSMTCAFHTATCSSRIWRGLCFDLRFHQFHLYS